MRSYSSAVSRPVTFRSILVISSNWLRICKVYGRSARRYEVLRYWGMISYCVCEMYRQHPTPLHWSVPLKPPNIYSGGVRSAQDQHQASSGSSWLSLAGLGWGPVRCPGVGAVPALLHLPQTPPTSSSSTNRWFPTADASCCSITIF